MDEEKFNMSLRKFLKNVGVTSQQQIEKLVREGGAGDGSTLDVKVVLTAAGTELSHTIEGEIEVG